MSFLGSLNQRVLKNQGRSCPALVFSTTSIEMGQQAKPVPILVPFLLKAGGDKLHQASSSPLVWYGERGLVVGRLWWNLPEFWGRQAFVQSGVSKEGSGLELPLSSLPLGFSWRVEGGALGSLQMIFFLDRLWKALNHFICRKDVFLWLGILDDQGSKGSWWFDVFRYIKALSPQTWYSSIPFRQDRIKVPDRHQQTKLAVLSWEGSKETSQKSILCFMFFFKRKGQVFFFGASLQNLQKSQMRKLIGNQCPSQHPLLNFRHLSTPMPRKVTQDDPSNSFPRMPFAQMPL